MQKFDIKDTIAAISTPVGKAGIGIIRISGSESIKIADRIFLSCKNKKVKDFKTFTMHYGWVLDCKNKKRREKSRIIDEVLLSVMKAPKSYTAEDVVEINCHSGIVSLKRILDVILDEGARLAYPGEFTKRAFINGRIDLTQAEAVMDVIDAQTLKSSEIAFNQLQGKLHEFILSLKEKLVDIYSEIQAFIEFPEETDCMLNLKDIKNRIKLVIKDTEKLAEDSLKGKLYRQGISVVLCGRPNAGKSSIMNLLLKEDRVIVTPVPGTTRDAVEETINIKGIAFNLIDTAGMIDSEDIVEIEGVKKSRKHIENSDIILLVIDSSRSLCRQDIDLMKNIKDKIFVVVLNKIDLPCKVARKDIIEKIKAKYITEISALTSKGLKNLENTIVKSVYSGSLDKSSDIIISNQRHITVLNEALENMKKAVDLSLDISFAELISEDIKEAIDKLSEITGEIFTEDILENIFKRFCIGK